MSKPSFKLLSKKDFLSRHAPFFIIQTILSVSWKGPSVGRQESTVRFPALLLMSRVADHFPFLVFGFLTCEIMSSERYLLGKDVEEMSLILLLILKFFDSSILWGYWTSVFPSNPTTNEVAWVGFEFRALAAFLVRCYIAADQALERERGVRAWRLSLPFPCTHMAPDAVLFQTSFSFSFSQAFDSLHKEK